MSIVVLTPNNRNVFIDRIHAVQEDQQPLWGELTPERMFRHLCYSLEMSLGDEQMNDRSNFITRTIARFLFFHVITRWPKGIKAPRNIVPENTEGFEVERNKLITSIDRFLDEREKEPERKTRHPVFGSVTLSYYGRIHGVHFNHHLRQFQV